MSQDDILGKMRLGRRYLEKAEQIHRRTLECQKRYEEAMTRLDKLRRRLVFVENGIQKPIELVHTIIELEEIRNEKKSLENRLKIYFTASFSYVLPVVGLLDERSDQMIHSLTVFFRHTAMIIRSARDLNIDFSGVYTQVLATRNAVENLLLHEGRKRYEGILLYLNQILFSIE